MDYREFMQNTTVTLTPAKSMPGDNSERAEKAYAVFLHHQDIEELNPNWPSWEELFLSDKAVWRATFPGYYDPNGKLIYHLL